MDRTQVYTLVCTLAREAVQDPLEGLQPSSSFASLGIDSLDLLEMGQKLCVSLGVRIEPKDIKEPTRPDGSRQPMADLTVDQFTDQIMELAMDTLPSQSTMREIKTHHGGDVNDNIRVKAGVPGVGGAPDIYSISYPPPPEQRSHATRTDISINFAKAGELGVTNEALLAILCDRLTGFQAGPFACDENAVALDAVSTALMALKQRTKRRAAKGLEGKMAEDNERIRITGDWLLIGAEKFEVARLKANWNAWAGVEGALKKLRPIKDEEWAVLSTLAVESAAKRGFTEARQAITQMG